MVKTGDELLTGGSDRKGLTNHKQALKSAYIAGYLERELDVREDNQTTIQLAERKAEHWLEHGGPSNE